MERHVSPQLHDRKAFTNIHAYPGQTAANLVSPGDPAVNSPGTDDGPVSSLLNCAGTPQRVQLPVHPVNTPNSSPSGLSHGNSTPSQPLISKTPFFDANSPATPQINQDSPLSKNQDKEIRSPDDTISPTITANTSNPDVQSDNVEISVKTNRECTPILAYIQLPVYGSERLVKSPDRLRTSVPPSPPNDMNLWKSPPSF